MPRDNRDIVDKTRSWSGLRHSIAKIRPHGIQKIEIVLLAVFEISVHFILCEAIPKVIAITVACTKPPETLVEVSEKLV
jgi:hypothetical protein